MPLPRPWLRPTARALVVVGAAAGAHKRATLQSPTLLHNCIIAMSHLSNIEVPGKLTAVLPKLDIALVSEGPPEDQRKSRPADQVVCQAGPRCSGRKAASNHQPEHPGGSKNLPQQSDKDNGPVTKGSTRRDQNCPRPSRTLRRLRARSRRRAQCG
jgi:hypothetical protein